MFIVTGGKQPVTQQAPNYSGSAGGNVYAAALILKYPGNAAASIETGDVKLSLDANNMLADQYNGSTYDNVETTSLPNT